MVKPWMFVLTGALLTIASAAITHYVVSANNATIKVLMKEGATVEERIDKIWETVLVVDQRKDTAIILMATATNETLIADYINQAAKNVGITLKETMDNQQRYAMFLSESDRYRANAIERIDDLYYTKISSDEAVQTIEQRNSIFANIALFSQVIGLILVLTRDLARR